MEIFEGTSKSYELIFVCIFLIKVQRNYCKKNEKKNNRFILLERTLEFLLPIIQFFVKFRPIDLVTQKMSVQYNFR